jgi:hypothetical protein
LSSNKLDGNLPDSIGHPYSGERPLRGLYLSDNDFEGSIPSSLCELENLQALFLDENRLDGSIPDCVGLIQSLRQLYLFKNKLSGQVPAELGSLLKLCKSCSFFSKYLAIRWHSISHSLFVAQLVLVSKKTTLQVKFRWTCVFWRTTVNSNSGQTVGEAVRKFHAHAARRAVRQLTAAHRILFGL